MSSDRMQRIETCEEAVLDVLNEHYFVNGCTWREASSYDVARHQSFHVAKAIAKMADAFWRPSLESYVRLKNEVLADLLIYAIELGDAFYVEWATDVCFDSAPATDGCDPFATSQGRSAFAGWLGSMIEAASRLGEVCDRADHGAVAGVDVGREIAQVFGRVGAELAGWFGLDITDCLIVRLGDMAEKYIDRAAKPLHDTRERDVLVPARRSI